MVLASLLIRGLQCWQKTSWTFKVTNIWDKIAIVICFWTSEVNIFLFVFQWLVQLALFLLHCLYTVPLTFDQESLMPFLYYMYTVGLQWYTGVPVYHDIFCHEVNIIYWTSYCDIYNTFTYASTNMGKHCLKLLLTPLPLFSPYARQFSKQTDEKNPCWAVFSVIFGWRTQQTHACFQLGLSAVQTPEAMSKTWGNTLLVLLLCNVSYRVSYHL